MKGIILAGGIGSRLWPLTLGTSKQLLPVYDKPLIYYPLATLIQLGMKEVLIIVEPGSLNSFTKLLGNGQKWGLELEYEVQQLPRGIAEALVIGENFIGDSEVVALALGDNFFLGNDFNPLSIRLGENYGAQIFAKKTAHPRHYGVVEVSKTGEAVSIEEKPTEPKSELAIAGLYILDSTAVKMAKNLRPSRRGELEITDILKAYLRNNKLLVDILSDETKWLDCGRFESLWEAAQLVRYWQIANNDLVGSPEQAAWKMMLIDDNQMLKLSEEAMQSGYGEKLLSSLERRS